MLFTRGFSKRSLVLLRSLAARGYGVENLPHNTPIPPQSLPVDPSTAATNSVVETFLSDPDKFLLDDAVSSSLMYTPEAAAAGASVGAWAKLALFQSLLLNVQAISGMPFWVTIAGFSVALRLSAVPLLAMSQREDVKMRVYNAELSRLNILRKGAMDPRTRQMATNRLVAFSDLVEIRHVRRFVGFAPLVLFLPMFATLKVLGVTHVAELSTGGLLWFTDLGAPDPYFLLPLANAGLLAANYFLSQGSARSNQELLHAELQSDGIHLPKESLVRPELPKPIKWLLYGTFALTGVITAKFHAGFFMFWIPSQLAGLGTTLLMKRWMRRWERKEYSRAINELGLGSLFGVASSASDLNMDDGFHQRVEFSVDGANQSSRENFFENVSKKNGRWDGDDEEEDLGLDEGFFDDMDSQ